jgi:hypothetical protein
MVSIGMANCELGVEGSKVVAKMISVMPSVTSVRALGITGVVGDEGLVLTAHCLLCRLTFPTTSSVQSILLVMARTMLMASGPLQIPSHFRPP